MSIEHIHFEIFAANLDWLEVCLPMLFVGFWIVSQAVAIFRKIAGAGVEKPAGRINMPVPAKGERVFVDGQVDISRQIEDFLSQRIESAKTQSPPVLRSPASPRQEQNRSLVVKKTPRPSQRKGTVKPPALPAKSASEKLPLSDSVQPVNAMDSGTTDVGRHVSEHSPKVHNSKTRKGRLCQMFLEYILLQCFAIRPQFSVSWPFVRFSIDPCIAGKSALVGVRYSHP